MPQSLSKVVIHVIFSTKDRYPWLDINVRSRMHAYLATVCRDERAEPFRVGGVADHVHLLTTLPRSLSQAEMVEGLKKKSSKWIKELAPEYRKFYWQRGLWSIFGEPKPAECCVGIYPRSRGNIIAAVRFKTNTATSEQT